MKAVDGLAGPRVSRVRWAPSYRIVPSRYPTVDLFERIADPADWDALFAVESLTNSRLRQEAGDISLVPPAHRVSGPGATFIMAPFTHLGEGGRFSTRQFGAYYAARSLETALRETIHHRERFLRATNEGPIELDMRELQATVSAALHDLRGERRSRAAVYDPDSYEASQRLATGLREAGSKGVVYDSVRHEEGECVAVFVPTVVRECRQGAHYCYVWDGARITHVYRKSEWRPV